MLHQDARGVPTCSRDEIEIGHLYRKALYQAQCYIQTKLSDDTVQFAEFKNQALMNFSARSISFMCCGFFTNSFSPV